MNLRSVPVRHQAFVTGAAGRRPAGPGGNRPLRQRPVYCRPGRRRAWLVGGYGSRAAETSRWTASLPASGSRHWRRTRSITAGLHRRRRGARAVPPGRCGRAGAPGPARPMSPDGRHPGRRAERCQGPDRRLRLPGRRHRARSREWGVSSPRLSPAGPPFVPLDALHLDRFGDAYANDAALRAACEGSCIPAHAPRGVLTRRPPDAGYFRAPRWPRIGTSCEFQDCLGQCRTGRRAGRRTRPARRSAAGRGRTQALPARRPPRRAPPRGIR